METKKIMWMLKKDLMVLWRHKPHLMSLLLFPIIMITLFGYGMGRSLENIPVVLVEQSEGPVTDQTVAAVQNMSLYDVKAAMDDPDKAGEWWKMGRLNQP